MKKSASDSKEKIAREYRGYVISRFGDEKKAEYYYRLATIILEKNGGRMESSELCREIKRVSRTTKEAVLKSYLLNTLLQEGLGIKARENVVGLIELPPKMKAEMSRTAEWIVQENGGEMTFDELCEKLSEEMDVSLSREELLLAVCHRESKLSVTFFKTGSVVIYDKD